MPAFSLRCLPLLFIVLLAGCLSRANELLPIPADVRGASVVAAVEVRIAETARASVAALDTQRPEPFAALLQRELTDVSRAYSLTSGRALKLIVEIDEIRTANALGAAFGRSDRLLGSVFIRDAETGARLGQLYIEVDEANAGLLGLVTRGGSVEEKLAQAFAVRTARAISGRDKPVR